MAAIQLINELVFWMAMTSVVAGLALVVLLWLRSRQGPLEADDDDGEDCGC